MRSSVVIQWNRLGDLLQTRALLRQLRAQDDQRTVLCCDARYARIAKLFPEVDDVWPVDLKKLSSLARHGNTQAEFVAALSELVERGQTITTDVYTLTRSLTAVTFAELLGPENVYGYQLSRGSLQAPQVLAVLDIPCHDPEYVSVQLSDLWASFAGLTAKPEWLEPLLPEARNSDETHRPFALICDAGEEHRRIPLEWQAALLNRLLEHENTTVNLIGYTAEADLLSDLAQNNPQRVKDLRGQTSLLDLCHSLPKHELVIGSDSGGLHLAASLGIPVIGLYFGGADCRRTGPYAPNSVVIQDPQWTTASANRICELAQIAVDGRPKTPDSDLVLWRPELDEFGMLYSSDAAKPADLLRTRQDRKHFFTGLLTEPTYDNRSSVPPLSGTRKCISIIIPERGGRHYTMELLDDLTVELADLDLEIILISSESTISLPPRANLTHFQSQEPLTFAQACNLGANQARHDLLFFLNNDTRIPAGGMTTLVQSFQDTEIASPVIYYPDGLIQNAGVTVNANEIRETAHGQLVHPDEESCDAVSGVAMLIHRDTFTQLGGFDESYANGYEDLDLCLRARERGNSCRVLPDVKITHYRGSSVGRFADEDRNLMLFRERWNNRLPKSSPEPCTNNKLGFYPLIILSDEAEESAGCCLRWNWPLERLGYQRGVDYVFVQTKCAERYLDEFSALLMSVQAVVVFRPISSATVQSVLLESLHLSCAKLLVDMDDMILGRFPDHSARAKERETYEATFRTLLAEADIVTASTSDLVSHLQSNGYQAELLPSRPDGRLMKPQGQSKPAGEQLTIGFFGTPSHLLDLGSILPALERLLETNRNLRFYWWGCRPGELAYHEHVRQGGPTVVDYATHLARLHAFPLDIAVVPLLDTPANKMKTAIKHFEYAGANVPTVYSKVKPYSEIVKDGITGLLAADGTECWIEQMQRLIEDETLRDQIASAAHRQIMRLTVDHCACLCAIINRMFESSENKPQEILACLA